MGGPPASSECLSWEGELRSSPQLRHSLGQREALPPIYLFLCNLCNLLLVFVREMQGSVRRITLARIIHEASTAAADPGMSTALRSVRFLDVLSSTPAESSVRAPCIHTRLRRLATNLHE